MQSPLSDAPRTSLLDLLWGGRLAIVACAIVGAVGYAGFAYVSKPEYEARTVLLMPYSAPTGLLGSLKDAGPTDYLSGILKSEALRRRVSPLVGVPIPILAKGLVVEPDKNAMQITIRFRSGVKDLALKTVSTYVTELNKVANESNFSVAKGEAAALKQTLSDRKLELAEAQRNLQSYMSRSKSAPVLDPDRATVSPWVGKLNEIDFQLGIVDKKLSSTRAKLSAAGSSARDLTSDIPGLRDWRSKLDELNYQLSIRQIELGPGAAEVRRLQEQVRVTKSQLEKEVSKYLQQVGRSNSLELITLEVDKMTLEWQKQFAERMVAVAPKEIVDVEQLSIRVVSLRGAIETLTKLFESKRVEAQVSSVSYSSLQAPFVDPVPTNKRYLYVAGLGAIAGAAIGSLIVALLGTRRRG